MCKRNHSSDDFVELLLSKPQHWAPPLSAWLSCAYHNASIITTIIYYQQVQHTLIAYECTLPTYVILQPKDKMHEYVNEHMGSTARDPKWNFQLPPLNQCGKSAADSVIPIFN